jgi:hypothetical protein
MFIRGGFFFCGGRRHDHPLATWAQVVYNEVVVKPRSPLRCGVFHSGVLNRGQEVRDRDHASDSEKSKQVRYKGNPAASTDPSNTPRCRRRLAPRGECSPH